MIGRKVSFYSSGSKISAIFNLPENFNKGKLPCVIFAHGYASYKDEFGGFIKLAEMFCNDGFAVLRFDFRGCGDSVDKNKKGKMLCASEWPEDIYNAFVFVSSMDFIDIEKISILGVSMGGATVLAALRFINNLRSAVVLCPVSNGYSWLKELWMKKTGLKSWMEFNEKIVAEREKRVLKNIDNFINVEEALAYNEKDSELFRELVKNYPQMSPAASFSSIEEIIFKVNPLDYIKLFKDHRILFVHGTNDTAVPFKGTERMYENYKGEKHLMLLEGRSHALILEEGCETYLKEIIKWIEKK
ncbi:MAG: alpha/beta fold hydrolase [Actinobacteria bacterium]|nr:alpha/beta fold hydrolase [Actinomycetota bacterium]